MGTTVEWPERGRCEVEPDGAFKIVTGDVDWLSACAQAVEDVPVGCGIVPLPLDFVEFGVWCEGIEVARFQRVPGGYWTLGVIACADAAHGVHPRYAPMVNRLDALRADLLRRNSRMINGPLAPLPYRACRRCGGAGWLAPTSAEAVRQRALVQAFGMFRGIINPNPPSMTHEEAFLALEAILGEPNLAELRAAVARPGGDDGGE
jgi:hypothetical protein